MESDNNENKKTEKLNLRERMLKMLETSQDSDYEVYVSNWTAFGRDPKNAFKVHKAVLAGGSSKFRDMIHAATKRGQQYITINNVGRETFQVVLKFIYGGCIDVKCVADACEVMQAAKSYDITELIVQCREYILNNVSAQNVCCVFKHFGNSKEEEEEEENEVEEDNEIEEEDIINKCIQILRDDTSTVLASPAFLECDESLVIALLRQDKLNVTSEAELISNVLAWVDEEACCRGLSETREDRETILKPLLPHLRLLSLSITEFTALKGLLNTLSPSLYVAIMGNIVNPLPDYICTNRNKRRSE